MRPSSIRSLSANDVALWKEIHDAAAGRASPFLHPAYVRTVSSVRNEVEVALVRKGGETVGFLPYERTRLGIGRSVGSRLCDVSGAIVRSGIEWDAAEVARGAGLRALVLSNVVSTESSMAGAASFAPFVRAAKSAPIIDLAGGFERYRRERNANTSMLRQAKRKTNKLGREVGRVRFEWHTADPRAFEALLAWKMRQREMTRTPNILRFRWSVELLERIRRTRDDGFDGVMSVLYAGDQVAWVHLGMRAGTLLHYWVTAYNPDLSSYSPGVVGMLHLVRGAAENGVERIDLGAGKERYKDRLSTGVIELADAVVAPGAAAEAVTRALYGVRAWSRESSAGGWLREARRAALRASYALLGTFDDGQGSAEDRLL
jgi:CelD/BcsL family acetyltransferase involved in cellulose biosynthesis